MGPSGCLSALILFSPCAAAGAAGDIQEDWEQEYGSQDFFGLIDEMRLWRRVRSAEQVGRQLVHAFQFCIDSVDLRAHAPPDVWLAPPRGTRGS